MTALRGLLKRSRTISAAAELAEHAARRASWALGRRGGDAPVAPTVGRGGELYRVVAAHGIAVVPDYWTAERCAAARDAIDAFLAARPERVWTDATGADRRVYGLERVDPIARAFHEDPLLAEVARAVWRAPCVNGFVSAGRVDAVANNRGSGGQSWHRDGTTQRFKAILYLSDVGEADGPFEYVRGTVRIGDRLTRIVRDGATARQRAFDDAGVARMEVGAPGSVVTACGPAGTLVVADTFGVHRGRPLRSGPRYALTNYYFDAASLEPVAAYYGRQIVLADGAAVTARALAGEGSATD